MKQLLIIVLSVLAVGLSSSLAVAGEALPGKTEVAKADAFIRLMRRGKFSEAAGHFDKTMAKAMSARQLQEAWGSISGKVGAYAATLEHRQVAQGDLEVVDAITQFANAKLVIRVVINKKGEVGGLWFLPEDKALPANMRVKAGGRKAGYTAAPYVVANKFSERKVTVGKDPWKLSGLLSVPAGKGPFPAVILIAGSGPNDMDETIGPNKPFRDLAGGLATRGIVALRYDKRTKAHGSKINAKTITVEEEVIADALSGLQVLRKHPSVNPKKIFVVGHSLGGTLAPVVAKRDGKVAGVVLLAGSARPLTAIIAEQLDYISSLPGHGTPAEKQQIAKIKADLKGFESGKLADDDMIMGASVKYLKDLDSRQTVTVASALDTPFLVMQGGRDYQVTKQDFDLWKRALSKKKHNAFEFYPSLNHLFGEGSGKATPEEYMKKKHVSETVIGDIAKFVKR